MKILAPLILRSMWLGILFALSACHSPDQHHWSGYAEGNYIYIASAVASTLKTLDVQEGQEVQMNAPLFTLDPIPEQAALAQANAQVRVAQAQSTNLTKGERDEEIKVLRAQLAQTRAQAAHAEKDWLRQKALFAQNFVSQAQLDDATTTRTQSQEAVEQLKAQLKVAQLPARIDERAAAQAQVDAAREAEHQQAWRTQQTEQLAPTAGVISEIFWRAGEYVPAGTPVLSLLPPSERKAVFYVPEAEVGRLKMGQAVQVQCDGCGQPITAHITRIATRPEFTPPVNYSNTERAKLVFLVEAKPALVDVLRLHPGQPLDVKP